MGVKASHTTLNGDEKLRRLVKAIDSTNKWIGQGISFVLILMALVIGYEVILRGFFNMPTKWAHEVSGMLFGASFLLGAGYILYHGGHVRVDILISRLRPRTQALINIITHLVMALFCAVVLWKSWHYAVLAFVEMHVSDSGWQPVLFPIKFVIVFGVFLLMLQLLAKYIRDFYMLFTGNELK